MHYGSYKPGVKHARWTEGREWVELSSNPHGLPCFVGLNDIGIIDRRMLKMDKVFVRTFLRIVLFFHLLILCAFITPGMDARLVA